MAWVSSQGGELSTEVLIGTILTVGFCFLTKGRLPSVTLTVAVRELNLLLGIELTKEVLMALMYFSLFSI